VKIIDSLPKDLCLVISFDSKTQLGVQSSQTLFQELRNVLGH
jgi:hypothetical protein